MGQARSTANGAAGKRAHREPGQRVNRKALLFITETDQGIAFRIYVQPRASRNAVAGIHGDALKVRITAPPIDGEANKMCIQYLAKSLGLPKSSLEIVSGHTGRRKQILVRWPDTDRQPAARAHLKKRVLALFEDE